MSNRNIPDQPGNPNPNKPPRKPGKVTLPRPKVVVLVPERTITTPAKTKRVAEFNILSIQDFPKDKRLIVITEELGRIVLWEGAQYDAIGQWTDEELTARLIELYS
jgi:hypothetical protein